MANKALFNKLLKEVRDEVLQPSIIVKAFSTCGYTPLDFSASYAYDQVPPPAAQGPVTPTELELPSSSSSPSPSDSMLSSSKSPSRTTDPVTPKHRPQHTCLYPSSPDPTASGSRPSGKPNPLGTVRQRIQALAGNVTPRRFAKVHKEVLNQARCSII